MLVNTHAEQVSYRILVWDSGADNSWSDSGGISPGSSVTVDLSEVSDWSPYDFQVTTSIRISGSWVDLGNFKILWSSLPNTVSI